MTEDEEFDEAATDGGDGDDARSTGVEEEENEDAQREGAVDEGKPGPKKNEVERGEFWRLLVLLQELVRTVDEPPRRTGHSHLPVADMLFIIVTKVFFGLSSRDHCALLELLHPQLWTGPIPHPNSITNYMKVEWLRPILEGLVGRSAQPVVNYLGYYFSIDSTPVLTPGYYLSKNRKTGELYERRQWIRLHLLGENMTGIVTAARADSRAVAEQAYFEPMLRETLGLGFKVLGISGDKNYCTKANARLARDLGVTPFLTVKKNAVRSKKGADEAWNENYDRAKSDDPAVRRVFRLRSRIESVNSVIKGQYEEFVLSKSEAGQYNEALCKVICHNLIVLIRYTRKLGLTPQFRK